jgi:perosamine synthetase
LEEAAAVAEVLQRWTHSAPDYVAQFEAQIAEKVGAKYAIAANSWGSAAHLVAILLDLKPQDEVIVPAISFQASANIFYREKARIVFAESHPDTFNLDPEKLEEKITPNTKAIVAVHMFGQPCDLNPIIAIARKHQLTVIQDAAHAPGAQYRGKGLGELGDFTIFSHQQEKNISTLGEGGTVVTNRPDWADKLRMLRSNGRGQYLGIDCNMTQVQAAVGLVQLNKLDRHNQIRRRLAYYLNEKLAELKGLVTPWELPGVKHVYHLYTTRVEAQILGAGRDELLKNLWKKRKIMAITYAPTVNVLPCYQKLGHGPGECPVSEATSGKTLALPISPRFTEADMDELVDGLKYVLALNH